MKIKFELYGFVLVVALMFSACSKDDPVIVNEEELITTVIYTLTTSGFGGTVEMRFEDLDGDGGDDPIITGGTLLANRTYTGTLTLLNEAESPAENITTEITEEDEDHQFFFQTDISDLSIAYSDQDADGNPVGLMNTLTTGASANGTITITLRHEPSKSASGVSNGDITNAGGETDIEVTFPVDVQ